MTLNIKKFYIKIKEKVLSYKLTKVNNFLDSVEQDNIAPETQVVLSGPDAIKNIQANALEENILGLLLIYDEYRQGILNGKIELSENDFVTAFGKKVFASILDVASANGEFLYGMLGQYFSAEEMGRLEKMRQNRLSLTENGIDVLMASVEALKSEKDKKASADSGDKFAILRAKQEKLKNQRK